MKQFFFIGFLFFFSCSVSHKKYNPDKKFTRLELQQDYMLLRNILEKKHPSLYWYTSRDSMNYYFDSLYQNIADSMTELQFGWSVLAPLIQKIHCGHTSFNMSKHWDKYIKDKSIPCFPLYLKVWGDTMVVTENLNLKDSVIKKGTLITSVNGIRNRELIQQLFQFLPLDGNADNVNYVRASSNFPYYHRNVFGLYKNYRVGYIDSSGEERTKLLPMFIPVIDTAKKNRAVAGIKKSWPQIREERRKSDRSLTIDTAANTAIMTINTFSTGGGRRLRSFIKQSFGSIRKQGIDNCIIDLRSNGGGDINMSVLLTKYLRNKPFKVADSAFAVVHSLKPYTKYIKQGILNNLALFFITKKHNDGNYHFGYWENHIFQPKIKNHFDGRVYVLTNGPTFSASTLFCNAIKGQSNIKLVGEETGGGWYGNNGLMIPDITLPITRLRVRLPVFRLVQYNHVPKNGRGVTPDIFIPPTVEGVRKAIDRKMEIVKGMIKQ